MENVVKGISGYFIKISPGSFLNSLNCFLLKNEECKVRKIVLDGDYMTYSYKIKVNRYIGSCNDVENPYFKVGPPVVVNNVSVKVFDLISQRNVLKNISFHQSCKCGCLLDERVC